jgi:hypothetical protein
MMALVVMVDIRILWSWATTEITTAGQGLGKAASAPHQARPTFAPAVPRSGSRETDSSVDTPQVCQTGSISSSPIEDPLGRTKLGPIIVAMIITTFIGVALPFQRVLANPSDKATAPEIWRTRTTSRIILVREGPQHRVLASVLGGMVLQDVVCQD